MLLRALNEKMLCFDSAPQTRLLSADQLGGFLAGNSVHIAHAMLNGQKNTVQIDYAILNYRKTIAHIAHVILTGRKNTAYIAHVMLNGG